MIEKDAVDSIITALKEAGTVIGQPALEYTITALRIEGIIYLSFSFICLAVGIIFFVIADGMLNEWLAVYDKYKDIPEHRRNYDGNDYATINSNKCMFPMIIGTIFTLLGCFGVFYPNNWLRVFSPIGYIVKSYLNI